MFRLPRLNKRSIRGGVTLFLALCIVLLIADYNLYPSFSRVGGHSFNNGENGLWLRYSWYFGEYKPVELNALAGRLSERQIRYAYFHVRYADASGSLHFHRQGEARRLNDYIHARAPGVRAIAWVFVGNQHGDGGVHLDNTDVRKNLVKEAVWLTRTCGFDGVQWDYEICDSGDKGFLSLLDESRASLPEGTLLCVAAPVWMPPPLSGLGWSPAYFGKVALRCDQITIMAYDTGVYLPRAYVWLVGKQITVVAPAVAKSNRDCGLLIGLPTYPDGTASHNPRAENLVLGLKGVREGLETEAGSRATVKGVALFADYTTTDRDWQTFRNLWSR